MLWSKLKKRFRSDSKRLPRGVEPFMSAELEDALRDEAVSALMWRAMALRELASQLGVGNDFYYPLLGAAILHEEMQRALWRMPSKKPVAGHPRGKE
jgi:D-alanyl-D-alanine dipeptidase